MKIKIFDRNGDPLAYLDAPEDQIEINIPDGGRFERLSDAVDIETLPVVPRKQEPAP